MGDVANGLSDLLAYLLSRSGLWVWLLAATAMVIILYIRPHPLWLTDLLYRLPGIGKLSRYSKDLSERDTGGWRNVELTLCHDYANYCTSLSREDFQNHIEYLRKTHDLGRKPTPVWALLLIGVLVAFEGLAFAYILGSWISIDSSENERILFMLAIVAVLAIVLVYVTHVAGRQIYRTKLLESCFQAWKQRLGPDFFTRVMSLSDDQSADDSEPAHVQCANRVVTRHGDYGSYVWVWVAVIFIALIAIGATYLRINTLDTSNDAELLANVFGELSGGASAAASDGPSNRTAAFVSFGILAAIFVVTQFVAMSFGYKYGFAGRESEDAYRETGGHTNYRSYWRGVQHNMNIANRRLQTLQRLLERRTGPINWKRTFFDYVVEQRAEGNANLHEPPPPPERPGARSGQGPAAEEADDGDGKVTPIDRSAK